MSIDVVLFISSQFLAILIFSLINLLAVRYRNHALQQEIRVHVEDLSLESYQRFLATRRRVISAIRRMNGIVLLIGLLVILIAIVTLPVLIIRISILLSFAFVIGFSVGAHIHDFVGTIFVDAEALRIYHMSTLQKSDIFALQIKIILFRCLPLILFFELLGVILLLGGSLYFDLVIGLVIMGSVVIIDHLSIFPLYAFLAPPMRDIEQTQWSFLAPRIAAWSQLVGVKFTSVRVQQDLVGTSDIRVTGLVHPTLIISEALLCYTEWRQQDAMIGGALGVVQKRMVCNALLYTLLLLVLAGTFVAALPFLLSVFGSPDMLIALFLMSWGALVKVRRALQPSSRFTTYYDVDRIAALLTGDPWAIGVALNTINALNGVLAVRGSKAVPSTNERMQKLDVLAQRPWPRAPQAVMPVPAITSVSFGPYSLTVPFTQATSPGPVPSVPYGRLV